MLCASVNDAVGTDVEVTHFRQQVDSHIPGPRVARVNQCAGVCAFLSTPWSWGSTPWSWGSVDTMELGFGIQSAGVCLGEAGDEDCAGG